MKISVAGTLTDEMTSCWSSWSYLNEEFAEDYQKLISENAVRRDGPFPVIWGTSQKFVLKISTASGKTVALKAYDKVKRPDKYLFRLSPCGKEAVNYQLFQTLELPMPKILAVGEVRKFRILKTAFLVTEFAEDFHDGRMFFQDMPFADQIALRDEFIRRNLELLAKCHDHNILHKGFTPFNLLFRPRNHADEKGNMLDILWIDVASCRSVSSWTIKQNATVDHEQLFRFFDFSDEELHHYLEFYTAACKRPSGTADDYLRKLKKALQKRKERQK